MVDRHLSIDHEFVCISDNDIDGIDTVKPINDLPGWWLKTTLFAPTVSRKRNLWLDLDVTITQNIDALVEPLNDYYDIRTILNWADSGHGGIQSSVMYWEGNSAQTIHDKFNHADAYWPPHTNEFWDNGQVKWGDQEWCTYLRDTNQIKVEYFDPAHVVSYKYHCLKGLPDDSLIQIFHGKPDPDEVRDEWVKAARS